MLIISSACSFYFPGPVRIRRALFCGHAVELLAILGGFFSFKFLRDFTFKASIVFAYKYINFFGVRTVTGRARSRTIRRETEKTDRNRIRRTSRDVHPTDIATFLASGGGPTDTNTTTTAVPEGF